MEGQRGYGGEDWDGNGPGCGGDGKVRRCREGLVQALRDGVYFAESVSAVSCGRWRVELLISFGCGLGVGGRSEVRAGVDCEVVRNGVLIHLSFPPPNQMAQVSIRVRIYSVPFLS